MHAVNTDTDDKCNNVLLPFLNNRAYMHMHINGSYSIYELGSHNFESGAFMSH